MTGEDQTAEPLYRLVEARHGRFLANPNDRFIGRALIDYGEYSEIETILLQSLLGAGETVVEIGANIGAHTVALARRVGPTGRVDSSTLRAVKSPLERLPVKKKKKKAS